MNANISRVAERFHPLLIPILDRKMGIDDVIEISIDPVTRRIHQLSTLNGITLTYHRTNTVQCTGLYRTGLNILYVYMQGR
jgi:hypothetical protein